MRQRAGLWGRVRCPVGGAGFVKPVGATQKGDDLGPVNVAIVADGHQIRSAAILPEQAGECLGVYSLRSASLHTSTTLIHDQVSRLDKEWPPFRNSKSLTGLSRSD